MKKIILWGATGQSIVLEEFFESIGYEIIALFDNDAKIQSPFSNVPIYYGVEGFRKWKNDYFEKETYFLVAIGGKSGKTRLEIHSFLRENGIKPAIAIHPTAYVAKNAIIEKGCQILANSTIGARTRLGLSTIINTSASVDHECVIGDGVHVGPGVKIAGCVQIDDCSFLGTGAVVLPRIKIGKNVIIGAGSIVTENLPDNVVSYGNPAKIIRNNFDE